MRNDNLKKNSSRTSAPIIYTLERDDWRLLLVPLNHQTHVCDRWLSILLLHLFKGMLYAQKLLTHNVDSVENHLDLIVMRFWFGFHALQRTSATHTSSAR
jgi:hypothetical protein